MASPLPFLPLYSCVPRQTRLPVGRGCFVVTAVTAQGETPFCATVCQPDGPAPIPIPPGPTPPGPISCVNYFLTNTTLVSSDFTWDAYPDATGYNVYISEDATPSTFTLAYANIPVSTLPLNCQSAIVTAITPTGESPRSCEPIHFCGPTGACGGHITFDPSTLSPWAWFKADALPVVADGTPVTLWPDSSGNGRDAAQDLTRGSPPEYWQNILGAGTLPALKYGPVGSLNAALKLNTVFSIAGNSSFTVIAIWWNFTESVQPLFGEVFPNGNACVWASTSQNPSKGLACRTDASNDLNSPQFTTALGGDAYMTAHRRDSQTVYFREGNVSRGSITENGSNGVSGAIRGSLLGANQSSSINVNHMNGYLAEVLLFTTFLTDAQVDAIFTRYAQPKWCLPNVIP